METKTIEIDKSMGIKLLTAYKPSGEDKLTQLMTRRNFGKWSFSVKEGEHWVWNKSEIENVRLIVIYGLIKLAKDKYKWN